MFSTLRTMGAAALVCVAMPSGFAAQASSPLPYQAVIGTTPDNQLLCHNCAGNGRHTVVQGGDDAGRYHFLLETPYYTFLAREEKGDCSYASWIAINKTRAAPYVEYFSVGCYPVKDFRAVDDGETTRFILYFRSGVTETIAFDH